MKRFAFFSIPAHGHTNPMIPVAAELVRRGNRVRFYSFQAFEEKIRAAGAEFVSCDEMMPELSEQEAAGLKRVSTTEMTVQDIRLTLAMDSFLDREFEEFQPDVVYSDAVCFWGKLNAWKHKVPLVVSTSTFAFHRFSSGYMKNSPAEMADMIFGLPRIARALKSLEPYGYHVKNPLSLVQNDNSTDTVVYASRRFQPCAESFSDHYTFVGPSLSVPYAPNKAKARKLVYVALGTVINERPDFYRSCIEALQGLDADLLISCGRATDPASLGPLPENVQVLPYVDQPEVLSRADAFVTHCGMNSVSEALYMGTPLLLFPQTGEQEAVARRVTELGAGLRLAGDSPAQIRSGLQALLETPAYAEAARACSEDFRACSGPAGAADFLESAPHSAEEPKFLMELDKASGLFQLVYWLLAAALMVLTGLLIGWRFVWIPGVLAGVLSAPLGKRAQQRAYRRLTEKKE